MLRTALIPSGVAVVYDPDHPNFVTLQYPGPISEYEAKRMAVMAKQKIGGFIKVKDDAGLVRAETSFWD